MDSETSAAPSRGKHDITPDDLQNLLARLHPDPARAWEVYRQLRQDLVRFFVRRDRQAHAEDLADQTLDELSRKPLSFEIRNVSEFAIGVARNLCLRDSRKNSGRTAILNDKHLADDSGDPEQVVLSRIDNQRKRACYLHCMERLKPVERRLIFEYYPAEDCNLEERRRALAGIMGIDPGALATRINRLRRKLVKCCQTCYEGRVRVS